MNLKIILKSLVLGCLLAFSAIIMEYLFLFYEDDIVIDPNPICLFVLHLLLFSGIVLLLLLQFRMHAEDGASRKFNTGILLQLILLVLYFVNIVINSLFFYGLAAISAALLVISVVMYFLRRDKKHLLQAGVYLFFICLCQLMTMAGSYWIVEG